MSFRSTPGRVRSVSAEARRQRRREGGFTLVEALVALLVVALAVTGATKAGSLALRVQADGLRRAEAATLADARLQELSLLGPDSLDARASVTREEILLGSHRFRRRSTVLPSPAAEGLWRAVVEVGWEAGSVRLATLLYRPRRDPVQGGAR